MNSGNEPCARGDALKKAAQRGAFFRGQGRGYFVFEVAALLMQCGQQAAGLGGERDSDRAPILGARQPLCEPSLFKLVDDHDHGIAVDPEAFGELTLRLAVGAGQR